MTNTIYERASLARMLKRELIHQGEPVLQAIVTELLQSPEGDTKGIAPDDAVTLLEQLAGALGRSAERIRGREHPAVDVLRTFWEHAGEYLVEHEHEDDPQSRMFRHWHERARGAIDVLYRNEASALGLLNEAWEEWHEVYENDWGSVSEPQLVQWFGDWLQRAYSHVRDRKRAGTPPPSSAEGQVLAALTDITDSLDAGGEQSRSFSQEIARGRATIDIAKAAGWAG
jgi:hypothetical protein